jgi:hypothetical protein
VSVSKLGLYRRTLRFEGSIGLNFRLPSGSLLMGLLADWSSIDGDSRSRERAWVIQR